jgi:hypothetical protein
MEFPPWVKDEPTRMNYLLRLAALHHNAEGAIALLATDCGFTPTSFYAAATRGTMTAGMASAIELAIGRSVVTKEMLCSEKR